MSSFKQPISEQSLLVVLLIAIAVVVFFIARDLSADMFNQIEYAMAKTLNGLDGALAGAGK